jgi:hypothetical protein
MTIQTTCRVVHDGERNLIMQLNGIADGLDQETNAVKVRASDFNCKTVKILSVTSTVAKGKVKLTWDSMPTPTDFLYLEGSGDEFCYGDRGLTNDAADLASGNILLSTSGFEPGSSYSILLKMVKKL